MIATFIIGTGETVPRVLHDTSTQYIMNASRVREVIPTTADGNTAKWVILNSRRNFANPIYVRAGYSTVDAQVTDLMMPAGQLSLTLNVSGFTHISFYHPGSNNREAMVTPVEE